LVKEGESACVSHRISSCAGFKSRSVVLSSDGLPTTTKQQPTIATLDLVPEHDTPPQTGLYNK
jgi:hypothetical protein